MRKKYQDPRTAKRYAESPQRPEYTLTAPKPTKLDPYKQKIDQWLEEAPYSAVRILEKLQEEGFDGKYSIVKEYVRGKKMDLYEKTTVRFETMLGKHGQMGWRFFEEHLVYEDGKWRKLISSVFSYNFRLALTMCLLLLPKMSLVQFGRHYSDGEAHPFSGCLKRG